MVVIEVIWFVFEVNGVLQGCV